MPNPDWGHSKGGRVSVLPCRAVPCSVWVSPCGCPRRPMAAGRSRGQQGTGTQLVRSWQLGSCLEQGPSLGLHIRWSSAAGRLPLPVPMQARAWTARFGQLPASGVQTTSACSSLCPRGWGGEQGLSQPLAGAPVGKPDVLLRGRVRGPARREGQCPCTSQPHYWPTCSPSWGRACSGGRSGPSRSWDGSRKPVDGVPAGLQGLGCTLVREWAGPGGRP